MRENERKLGNRKWWEGINRENEERKSGERIRREKVMRENDEKESEKRKSWEMRRDNNTIQYTHF